MSRLGEIVPLSKDFCRDGQCRIVIILLLMFVGFAEVKGGNTKEIPLRTSAIQFQ